MVVYLDLLIIATIIVNYSFIKTISIVFLEKVNIFRLIISSILSAISLVLFLLPYKIYYSIRYLVGIPIGLIAFFNKDIKQTIVKVTIYYFLNLAFIGCLFVFNVKSYFIMILTLIYIVVMYIVQSYQKFTKEKLYVDVIINDLKLKGFLDTGNFTLYDDIPVIYIKDKYFSGVFNKIDSMMINFIDEKKLINIYNGPKIIINKKEYIVYYVFTSDIPYDIILNHQMIGGIK